MAISVLLDLRKEEKVFIDSLLKQNIIDNGKQKELFRQFETRYGDGFVSHEDVIHFDINDGVNFVTTCDNIWTSFFNPITIDMLFFIYWIMLKGELLDLMVNQELVVNM